MVSQGQRLGPGNVAIPCFQHLALQTVRNAHVCVRTHTSILMHTASSVGTVGHGGVTLRISDEFNSLIPLTLLNAQRSLDLHSKRRLFLPFPLFSLLFFPFFFFFFCETKLFEI